MVSFEYLHQITETEDAARQFLQERRVLRWIPPDCPQCVRPMSLVSKDGRAKVWRCSRHRNEKISERRGSYFFQSNLRLTDHVKIIWSWAMKLSVDQTVVGTGLGNTTVIQHFQYCRDVCSHKLANNPYKIGGPGIIVEIDESVMAKRKYHRGHQVPERWVFGGYCPQTKEGFLEIVPNRTAATLLPLIQDNIEAGSIIHSDE